jgi:hypothetical protein
MDHLGRRRLIGFGDYEVQSISTGLRPNLYRPEQTPQILHRKRGRTGQPHIRVSENHSIRKRVRRSLFPDNQS